MDPVSILLLAVGLAMDAVAVAGARGLAASRVRLRDVALVGALFGGFQAGMPLVGWVAGLAVGPAVAAYHRWIASVVLVGLGLKMLHEAWSGGEEASAGRDAEGAFALGPLVALAVATSIDALAVGVTLPMLDAPVFATIGTIGLVTAALSMGGVLAGRRFGAALGSRVDVVGGLVLVALGVKTFVS